MKEDKLRKLFKQVEFDGNKMSMPDELAEYLKKLTGKKTASGAVNSILREGIAVEKKIQSIGKPRKAKRKKATNVHDSLIGVEPRRGMITRGKKA